MGFLTDAELVLGLSRHLSAYQMTPERAALDQLEFTGRIFDMAFRLRGSGTNTPERVAAIGLEVGLGPRTLKQVVAVMESLGWLSVERAANQSPVSVADLIPAPADLLKAAPSVLATCMATPTERALLAILRATTLQPLLKSDALNVATTGSDPVAEEDAESALRKLVAVGLVRRVRSDDGDEVYYNPNVWVDSDDALMKAALRAAGARATAQVTALLEELALTPGLPESHVKSVEPKWIAFAVSQGLVHRSVIQTSDLQERAFLFTPHLERDAFGAGATDASGQVKQLVGSMIYAQEFAAYKLHSPDVFLQRLIANGVAGDATSIGTDYPMLEKAGIVRVSPGSSSRRFRLELLQADVAEAALDLLTSRDESDGTENSLAAVRGQRSYVHTETDRAVLALTTEVDEVEQSRLVAALRDLPAQRNFGSRP